MLKHLLEGQDPAGTLSGAKDAGGCQFLCSPFTLLALALPDTFLLARSLSNLLALVFTTHTHMPLSQCCISHLGDHLTHPCLGMQHTQASVSLKCLAVLAISGPHKSETIAESSWQATTPRAMHRQWTKTYPESSCVKGMSTWFGASA